MSWVARQLSYKPIDFRSYKGLGEMNASQLWETTLDPNARTMPGAEIDWEVEADSS